MSTPAATSVRAFSQNGEKAFHGFCRGGCTTGHGGTWYGVKHFAGKGEREDAKSARAAANADIAAHLA